MLLSGTISPAGVSSQLSESSVTAGPSTNELLSEAEPPNEPPEPDVRCPDRRRGESDVRSDAEPIDPPWNEPWSEPPANELPWNEPLCTLILPWRCGTGSGTDRGEASGTGTGRDGTAAGIARGDDPVPAPVPEPEPGTWTDGRRRLGDVEACETGLGGAAMSPGKCCVRVFVGDGGEGPSE